MNTLFAPFEPDSSGSPLPEADVRVGVRDDLLRTGALAAQREGGLPADWVAQHERRFDTDGNQLFVVELGHQVIGYGWVSFLTPVDHGGRNAPDGWYLSGVVIAPGSRRRGLGRRLTQKRVDWALARGSAVYYVVSASNRASRALHAELGFEELTDDFRMPGVVFSRDDGLLCRLVSRQDAEVVDLASRR
ncbi:MAG TPA: GNAT family N-acetyltransferase [Propioniciclava sp.]|uniref:GNAT family N-acetyltransferase n=1 Tax=Propioniciclava sp. TaxID=2038686 RepID=UPI002CF0339D|nr:GNAT family N-acetyltransferase [Propioniciclava sp.]HRL50233.1 GNAT family N-acetyltransferase [Propioniciclava sp.]HRL80287.1 GNAT family N-acetyltransferase [Propioniciclava sp.]